LIGLEGEGFAGFGLTDLDHALGGVGEHVLRGDFYHAFELVEVGVLEGGEIGVY
jgi:hypothetical protein